MNIGIRLKALQIACRKGNDYFANLLGIESYTFKRIKNNELPLKENYAKKISEQFLVSAPYLLRGTKFNRIDVAIDLIVEDLLSKESKRKLLNHLRDKCIEILNKRNLKPRKFILPYIKNNVICMNCFYIKDNEIHLNMKKYYFRNNRVI